MVVPTVTVPLALLLKNPKVQSIQKRDASHTCVKEDKLYGQTVPLVHSNYS